MHRNALFIGNSDGIGLATTRRLLEQGWSVVGISRSESPLCPSGTPRSGYQHHVARVQDAGYPELLEATLRAHDGLDLCVYCAGIGELLDPEDMQGEAEVFQVNLMGLVETASRVIPTMVKRGSGHLIGISSVADEILSAEAPGYHASKAAFSSYLEGMGLALRPRGVHVTNVRFGFVDTKMAKGPHRPFMLSVERAADHVMACIDKKPIRHTAPRSAIPAVRIVSWLRKLRLLLGG